MIHFSKLFTRLTAALMLGSLLLLAGCHRGSTKSEADLAAAQKQFDATIQSYKGGQFLVDGGVVSAIDLGSHFAYLKDQGKLPKTVFLEPSEDSKIRKQHLQYMARLQLDYGFHVYYDDKGTLTEINPVQVKARALEDYHAPVAESSEQKGKDAAGTSAVEQQEQQEEQQH